ncbi:MAG: hypothetical protein MMC23_005146 [Stictis urceolatum]|nr:hypothetical protein [Stictis urceolata]
MLPGSGRHWLSRRIVAPVTAFTMACILFVYSRTSIRAAKANAQRHREADGGQINWQRESQRRHGVLETPSKDPEGGKSGSIRELMGELGEQFGGGGKEGESGKRKGGGGKVGGETRAKGDERVREQWGRRSG